MDTKQATIMFGALSQETRLEAFRLLVEAGPGGLPAGTLSMKLGTPHNTMSFHLNHLSHAGVVRSRRAGRSVIYSADFGAIQQLVRYLIEDCCSAESASIREDRERGCSIIELSDCC